MDAFRAHPAMSEGSGPSSIVTPNGCTLAGRPHQERRQDRNRTTILHLLAHPLGRSLRRRRAKPLGDREQPSPPRWRRSLSAATSLSCSLKRTLVTCRRSSWPSSALSKAVDRNL